MRIEDIERRNEEQYARYKEKVDRSNALATEAVLVAARIARYGSPEQRSPRQDPTILQRLRNLLWPTPAPTKGHRAENP
jgi:hypothetical protein